MGNDISLFSGYNQQENRTTNYCLLILKILYDENPKFFASALSGILGENVSDRIGVKFFQQERRGKSIPDGVIVQAPVTFFIETKNFDWFYDAQLEAHLDGLSKEPTGLNVLLAIGKFESLSLERFEKVKLLCSTKFKNTVSFAAITFEDFLETLQELELPKALENILMEFEDYLNIHDLLPTWKGSLDVVNCAGTPDEVRKGQVYLCPATSGNYTHTRSKYLGLYKDKCVEAVTLIEAVIDLTGPTEATVRWKNIEGKTDPEWIAEARKRHTLWRPGDFPTRVFILDQLWKTNFVKDSIGGLRNSKRYFNISRLNIESSADLAAKLDGRVWSKPLT